MAVDLPALPRRHPRLDPVRRALHRVRPAESRVVPIVRLALLLVAALLALEARPGPVVVAALLAVIGLALAATVQRDGSRLQLLLLLAEAAAVGVGVVAAGASALPLLTCLPSTLLATGRARGYAGVLCGGGVAALVLVLGRVVEPGAPEAARATTQASAAWLLVALTVGTISARLHRLTDADRPVPEARYVEAYRLLAQLRNVAQSLPGSLDPGTVARTLLEECVSLSACEHGAVLLQVGGDQLVPLALHGYQRVPWRARLDDDGPIARAWLTRSSVVDHRRSDDGAGGRARRGSVLLVLPMLVEDHLLGVVALETRREEGFPPLLVEALRAVVREHELPLETAALFDELRMGAAAEERSRLAREMHDGIAQDLASLGYELDAVTAVLRRTGADEALPAARALRQRITELMGDLRLSMTDLRSSVGPGRGLGSALSEYLRAVGTSTGITVHLTLTEGSTRLPADTEVQLLRIAHEAILRARRRVGTANLWVTLTVDPPAACLVIEDDAPGEPDSREDRSGLEEMGGRASRLGAVLRSQPRTPTGTRTSVTVRGASA